MDFFQTEIKDIIIFKPKVYADSRGYFLESYRKDILNEAVGHKLEFVQENESKSSYGVLRGLHFQLPPFAQSKLAHVIKGKALDIVVDIRKGSPTFGKHVSVELSDENKNLLFVPRGFAHGIIALSKEVIFSYKVDNYYSQEHDRGVAYNDPALNINWHVKPEYLQLSDKDRAQPFLADVDRIFDYRMNLYE